jgi:hypothetical protein
MAANVFFTLSFVAEFARIRVTLAGMGWGPNAPVGPVISCRCWSGCGTTPLRSKARLTNWPTTYGSSLSPDTIPEGRAPDFALLQHATQPEKNEKNFHPFTGFHFPG